MQTFSKQTGQIFDNLFACSQCVLTDLCIFHPVLHLLFFILRQQNNCQRSENCIKQEKGIYSIYRDPWDWENQVFVSFIPLGDVNLWAQLYVIDWLNFFVFFFPAKLSTVAMAAKQSLAK